MQSCCLLVFEILGDATYTADHSTEIKKFMLDEMFQQKTYQNFPQFWNTKTQVDFFPIPIISALVYVDQGKVNEIFTWVFIFQRYGKFQVFQWEKPAQYLSRVAQCALKSGINSTVFPFFEHCVLKVSIILDMMMLVSTYLC